MFSTSYCAHCASGHSGRWLRKNCERSPEMRREEHYPPLTNAQLNSSPSLALKSLRSFMSAAHCKFAFLIFRSITPCCENVGTNCQMNSVFIAQIMQRDRGGIEAFFSPLHPQRNFHFFPRSWKEGNCAEARARVLSSSSSFFSQE